MVVLGLELGDFSFYGLVFIKIQRKVGSKSLWEHSSLYDPTLGLWSLEGREFKFILSYVANLRPVWATKQPK